MVREGQGEVEQVTRLRGLVFHLPMAHYHTLRFLTVHLNKVVEHAEQNKVGHSFMTQMYIVHVCSTCEHVHTYSGQGKGSSLPTVPHACSHGTNTHATCVCGTTRGHASTANRALLTVHYLSQMVLRNVAMVFGPTLMLRSSPTEELDLVAMNNTFTVVELLCKHVR